jgi:serine/threonine protein phosphatase PrpC
MTGQEAVCPQCAGAIARTDRFCESCGEILAQTSRAALPRPGRVAEGPCPGCGNTTFADDYCTNCGQLRALPDRDEVELGRIALITDRGLEHAHNEDAAAAGVLSGTDSTGPEAIAVVVCDGVSASSAAHTAAVAASAAGVDAMLAALTGSLTARPAVFAGLTAAAIAAAEAGSATEGQAVAPSCTYTAAVIIPGPSGTAQVAVGNVGDSRVYWFPDPPGKARQVTVDDSLAQELIANGVAADSPAVARGAHTLTRWLGADADSPPWSSSAVQTMITAGPGSVVLCSDGLWNYLPDPADIAQFCTGADPATAGRKLTDYALAAGGQDNITVVVIPIGGVHELD